MSREPVTPENPLGLVRAEDIEVNYKNKVRNDGRCPICGHSSLLVFLDKKRREFLNEHIAWSNYSGRKATGVWDCPGSRMILEEYQPVTLDDCNARLDRLIEMLEAE